MAVLRGHRVEFEHVDVARLTMRQLSDAFLESYLATNAATPDTAIVVDVRGRPRWAHVARRPLVARSPRTD